MSEKHKRSITNNLTDSELKDTLSTIEDMINSLGPKQQHIMSEWLKVWADYIKFEKSFIPQRLKYYKRGEIVLVHFGYNVGCELGGSHYAVIVENDNNKKNNVVTVVPISSLSEGKSKDDLHHSEVYLGKIFPNSNKLGYAMPSQIRTISKLRIIKPKSKTDGVYTITSNQLNELDDKLKALYTYIKK